MSYTSETICTKCKSTIFKNISLPPSPCPALVQTNHAPSELQVEMIRLALSQAHSDLGLLDNEIFRLQLALDELKLKRTELDRFSSEHELLLSSPIRSMPPEILSNVFIECLPAVVEDIKNHQRAPSVLARVCSLWRNVAISTPQLWSKLKVANEPYSILSNAALVATWLGRTGGCPLDINLLCSSDPKPLLAAITPYADRCRNISFAGSKSFVTDIGVVKHRLSSLKNLELNFWYDLLAESVDTFEDAPQLCSLRLKYGVDPFVLKLPWTQLTDFRLLAAYYTLDQCLEILSHTINLATCELRLEGSALRETRPLIQLPRLHTLQIYMGPTHGGLFDHLILPALCHLGYKDDSGVWPHSEFISLLSRSSCSLRTLSFRFSHTPMSDNELIECLQCTPMLTELQWNGSPTAVLARLTHRESASSQTHCLVPKLKHLMFERHTEFDEIAFVEMIRSRWRTSEMDMANTPGDKVVRIRSITLCSATRAKIDFGPLSQLREFEGEGLGLNVDDYFGWESVIAD